MSTKQQNLGWCDSFFVLSFILPNDCSVFMIAASLLLACSIRYNLSRFAVFLFYKEKFWRFEKCLLMLWFSFTLTEIWLIYFFSPLFFFLFLFCLKKVWSLCICECGRMVKYVCGYGYELMVCGFYVAIFLHLNIYIAEPMAQTLCIYVQ